MCEPYDDGYLADPGNWKVELVANLREIETRLARTEAVTAIPYDRLVAVLLFLHLSAALDDSVVLAMLGVER